MLTAWKMTNLQARRDLLASAAMLGVFAGGPVALAQTAASLTAGAPAASAPSTVGLEEVVVTAERRSTNVQHSALNITALAGDALLQGGAVNAQSLIAQVPGLFVSNAGPLVNVYIHGIGGAIANSYGDPAVSYNVDDVYLARPFGANSTYYDLNRVEVLKGPQGTLYGRNASAGAINVISNKPVIGRLEADGNVQVGNYDDVETEGAVNVPIDDELAARVSFRTVRHNGYLSLGESDADSQAVRAKLLYAPTDNFNVVGTVSYFHDGGRGAGTVLLYTNTNPIGPSSQEFVNPSNPWTSVPLTVTYPQHNLSFVGLNVRAGGALAVNPENSFLDNRQLIASANANWNLGPVTLTVIPSYVRTPSYYESNSNAIQQVIHDDSKQTTLEARIANNDSGPLRWIVGGYFLNEDQAAAQQYLQNVGTIFLNVKSTDRSYAGFGQATYSVSPTVRLTAGIRYSSEEKTQNGDTNVPWDPFSAATCSGPGTTYTAFGTYTDPLLPPPGNFIPFTKSMCDLTNTGRLTFGATTYKAGVEWDVAPQSLLYANISTGFKAGGFNPGGPPTGTSNHPATYQPERLTAYVAGTKNRFLDNRVQFNAEAYYWKYDNADISATQNINPSGFAISTINGQAHVWGVDTDTNFLVTPNDLLSLSLSWEGSRWDNYVLPAVVGVQGNGAPLTIIGGSNLTGQVRTFTPEWSGTAGYNHTFPLADTRVVFDATSHFESSEWLSDTRTSNNTQRPSFHMSNMSLTYWAPSNRWSVGAFVNNLENSAVLTSSGPSNVLLGGYFGSLAPPRTFGVRFSAKMGG